MTNARVRFQLLVPLQKEQRNVWQCPLHPPPAKQAARPTQPHRRQRVSDWRPSILLVSSLPAPRVDLDGPMQRAEKAMPASRASQKVMSGLDGAKQSAAVSRTP